MKSTNLEDRIKRISTTLFVVGGITLLIGIPKDPGTFITPGIVLGAMTLLTGYAVMRRLSAAPNLLYALTFLWGAVGILFLAVFVLIAGVTANLWQIPLAVWFGAPLLTGVMAVAAAIGVLLIGAEVTYLVQCIRFMRQPTVRALFTKKS